MKRRAAAAMRQCLIRSLWAVGGLLLAASASAWPDQIFLVRHAERAGEPAADPGLSAAGQVRAQSLAEALVAAGVREIITSQFRRTRETAAPLAQRLQIEARPVPARRGEGAAHIQEIVALTRAQSGGALLIVGHSNTVPALIAALGGPQVAELCESSYQHLFVLRPAVAAGVQASLAQLRYGEPSPAAQAGCL